MSAHKTVSEMDALRIAALGQERRACDAEMELLQQRYNKLIESQRVAHRKIREIMVRNGLDPEIHAVVSRYDAELPMGTAVIAKTGAPLPEKESDETNASASSNPS